MKRQAAGPLGVQDLGRWDGARAEEAGSRVRVQQGWGGWEKALGFPPPLPYGHVSFLCYSTVPSSSPLSHSRIVPPFLPLHLGYQSLPAFKNQCAYSFICSN